MIILIYKYIVIYEIIKYIMMLYVIFFVYYLKQYGFYIAQS